MQITSNQVSYPQTFKSSFVNTPVLKESFNIAKKNPESYGRGFAAAIKGFLNDGKNDVIKFTKYSIDPKYSSGYICYINNKYFCGGSWHKNEDLMVDFMHKAKKEKDIRIKTDIQLDENENPYISNSFSDLDESEMNAFFDCVTEFKDSFDKKERKMDLQQMFRYIKYVLNNKTIEELQELESRIFSMK